jgi:hypothetical protein
MTAERKTYTCPICNQQQQVIAGAWENVFAQVLTHFSSCAPPSRYPDTNAVMDAAATIANTVTQA